VGTAVDTVELPPSLDVAVEVGTVVNDDDDVVGMELGMNND
jgi:hypothetical protein